MALSVAVVPAADAYFASQWYLSGQTYTARDLDRPIDIRIAPVWAEYSGANVRVGLIDQAFDYSHSELTGRFDLDASIDPRDAADAQDIRPDTINTSHGTMVAGILGAAADGEGTVGVAYGATLVGAVARFGSGGSSVAELSALMDHQINVDVVNNSWGTTAAFSDNFQTTKWHAMDVALDRLVTDGRDGLGTVVVFASGNDRAYVAGSSALDGDNTNSHNLTNDIRIITVASSNEYGEVSAFSTPGASVFVAAPGENLLTSRPDNHDNNVENDYIAMSGTSAAAPVISGVVALMLEANDDLGYRDVQAILAASSQRAIPDAAHWMTNGAVTWNGGGYMVSDDLGFGIVDAHAAVRLAETWAVQSTSGNVTSIAGEPVGVARGDIPQDAALTLEFSTASLHPAYQIEWVELNVDITHTFIGDLRISLVSSTGMESVLVDRPRAGTNSADNLSFNLTSNQFWGEGADGVWTVRIEDLGTGGIGTLNSATLTMHGTVTAGQTQILTDDFHALSADRSDLNATAGEDILNAAAVTAASRIDLTGATSSQIDNRDVTFGTAERFETVISGDGADTLIGSASDETFDAGRGDDTIDAGKGRNHITGGAGTDTLVLAGNRADYVIGFNAARQTIQLRAGDEMTIVTGVEHLVFADGAINATDLAPGAALVTAEASALQFVGEAISEASAFGTIVGSFKLAGADASRFSYALVGNARGMFTIDAATGIVRVANGDHLDFETATSHRITVRATDGFTSLVRSVEIDVADAHESASADFAALSVTTDAEAATVSNVSQSIEAAISQASAGIIASLDLGIMQLANAEFVELTSRIEISGTAATDFLFGSANGDVIQSGAGADLLMGQGGDDLLEGNAGIDNIFGGEGNDVLVAQGGGWLQGDAGNDVISFEAPGDDSYAVAIGNEGDDVITISSARATPAVVLAGAGNDRVQGGAGNDWLQGDAGNDVIDGGAGNDVIIGGGFNADAGVDTVSGGEGNDLIIQVSGSGELTGGAGNDEIWGAGAADQITGSAGSDRLVGLAGADTFIFNAGDMGAGDRDEILDFAGGEDQIYLAASVQNSLTFENQGQGVLITVAQQGGDYQLFVYGHSQASIAQDLHFIL